MQARTLEPSSALSFAEAAVLAGVEPECIAALADSGELLHEGSRDRSRDERVVRLVELAELFPHVLGGRIPAAPADPDGAPDGDLALREVDVPRPDLAEEILASGASRDALVELAQDLETRLDLAERERQASTASLLMAQRRVLDLELRLRRRPWFLAGTAAATVLSCVALLVLARLPGMIEATTSEQLGAARVQAEAELVALEECDRSGPRGGRVGTSGGRAPRRGGADSGGRERRHDRAGSARRPSGGGGARVDGGGAGGGSASRARVRAGGAGGATSGGGRA